MADYYPGTMEGKAYWHAKFSQNIAGLAAKYSYREYNSNRSAASNLI